MKSSQFVYRYKLNDLLDDISNCYVYHDSFSSYALYASAILNFFRSHTDSLTRRFFIKMSDNCSLGYHNLLRRDDQIVAGPAAR